MTSCLVAHWPSWKSKPKPKRSEGADPDLVLHLFFSSFILYQHDGLKSNLPLNDLDYIPLYPTGMSIDDYPCQSLPSQWSLSLRLFDVHPWRSLLSSRSPRRGRCRCRYSDGAVAVTLVSRSLRSSSCFLMPTTEEGEGVAFVVGIMQHLANAHCRTRRQGRACVGSPQSGGQEGR